MDSLLTLAVLLATFAGLVAAAVVLLRGSRPERRNEALAILLLCAGVFVTSLVASLVVRSNGAPPPAPATSASPSPRPRPPATPSTAAKPAAEPSQRAQPCEIAATCERLAESLAESHRRPPLAPGPFGSLWVPYVVAGALLLVLLLMSGRSDPWIVWTKRAAAVIGVVTATVALARGCVETLGAYRALSPAPTRIVSLVPVPEPRRARPVAFAVSVSWPIVVGDADAESPAFVVPFAEARCRGRAKVSEWPGARPSPAFVTFLEDLGTALAQCAQPGRAVRVAVRGFASSSDFERPESCDESVGDLNLALANERALGVAAALKRCGKACPELLVTPHRWASSAEMRRAARFHDRLLRNAYSPQRGTLNRRAEILIEDAGDCALAVDAVDVEARPPT